MLGAGLAGLSAALHLQGQGLVVRHVEREHRVGGHAVTIEDEGFRFDRTGHLLHLRDPEIRALVLDVLGDDVRFVDRKSEVFSHGVYTRYPFQANTFGLPPDVAYECVKGFVDAHFAGPRPKPENFEEYCVQTFGEGIARHFMVPYNARLWGVSPSEITAEWCARFVPVPTLAEVLAGAVGVRGPEVGYNARFVYPRSGIGALPEGLARRLPPVELGRAPLRLDCTRKEAHFAEEVISYGRLISTVPLDALGQLMVDPPPDARAAFSRLRCTSLCYLDLAVNGELGRDFHWIYVPEAKFPFYRIGAYSSFSSDVAPPGMSSLYVELASRDVVSAESVLPEIIAGLTEMGIVAGPSAIRFARLRRLRHAYVIFDHAYFDALAVLRPFLERASVLSVGRYGGWNYSSMEDALLFGRAAARSVLDGSGLYAALVKRRPAISIVIPVYNEEAILHAAVNDLRERLAPYGWSYEVVLAENGSRDGTVAVAAQLAQRYPEIRAFSLGAPNYGAALRRGIIEARGDIVICEEIDLCDTVFHASALAILESGAADFVVGSKLLRSSTDDRPATRHAASLFYNAVLRAMLGFEGTDTHGLKAFRRDIVLPVVEACLVDKDVFASELVIRSARAGVRIREIPVRVMEKRPPSVDLARRVPAVVKQLAKLTWSIRGGGDLTRKRER